jgi:hypothetical protein
LASRAAAAKAGGEATDQAAAKLPLIALIRAADWMGSEWGEDAIKLGLRESDLEAGRDYELQISSAQGDLATLPSLIDAAIDAQAKVIVTLQDATLQAAVQRAKSVPIVFNLLPIRSRPAPAPATPATSPTSRACTRPASAIRSRPAGCN